MHKSKDADRPPVHAVVIQRWHDDPPTEPGYYWFYGDPWMGQMGGHYAGTVGPENRLMLVEVQRVANGVVGVASGHFISLRKWDGRQAGCEGRWTAAIIPNVSNSSTERPKEKWPVCVHCGGMERCDC